MRRSCLSLNTIRWSRHSRRILPISRSAYGFCHGDRAVVVTSSIPILATRLRNSSVHHAGGKGLASTYVVNFLLPNQVGIPGVLVSECTDCPYCKYHPTF